jgi:hypothetical protein
MGIAIGDWDNDGDPDIFLTHWISQGNALFDNFRLAPGDPNPSGKLFFGDIASLVGLAQPSMGSIGWGTCFMDYDNDGKLDLFVVNGSTFQDDKNPHHLVPMKDFLFWQKSPSEGFFDVGSVSGPYFQKPHVGRGAAFADYDNDGDIDVFVVDLEGRGFLLRNDGGNKKNWLKVRPRCSQSNRSCFGTKIEIEAAGQKQVQELGGQTSYLSQNFLEAHFGLDHEREALRVTVTFPTGVIRTMEHVSANRIVVVTE